MTRDATSPEAAEVMSKSARHHNQDQHKDFATTNPTSESSNGVPRSCGEYGEGKPTGDRDTNDAVVLLPAEERATSTVIKESLLTPPVSTHCALALPSAPIVSGDEQEHEAADKGDDRDDEKEVEQAVEEPRCEAETALRTKSLKRNRRALFATADGDAGQNRLSDGSVAGLSSVGRDGEPAIVSNSHSLPPDSSEAVVERQQEKQSDEQEVDATLISFDCKRAPPREVDFHTTRLRVELSTTTTTVATTRNAFDDPEDGSALLIRKKWKHSLHQTTLSGAQQQQQASDIEGFASLVQPSYPSFTRSMSSHSVFISKSSSISSTPSSISSSASSSSSAQPHEAMIHQLVLPTIRSTSHPDLSVISPQTVSRLLNGDFDSQLASYALIDCRFSYEHEGGCLRGAQSLCDPASVEQAFLWNPSKVCKRTALVFYCEFSANRAPKMLRHVRNLDRWIHAEKYPELFYPELYLVDGGYKNCFETMKDAICEPQNYTPMNHEDFVESCKREFALWRKRWKAHKTSACAAKLQLRHHHQKPATSSSQLSSRGRTSVSAQSTQDDDGEEDFSLELPELHPPVALRSFSEML